MVLVKIMCKVDYSEEIAADNGSSNVNSGQ